MAENSTIRFEITTELGKLNEGLDKANDVLSGFANDVGEKSEQVISAVEKSATKIGDIFAGTFASNMATKGFDSIMNGIKSVGNAMIGGNAEMETYTTQFATLMGSADAAKERLAELAKFGAETPFELPEIARAEKVLLGFGLNGKKAMDLFGKDTGQLRTLIGDIAAGTGQKFEDIANYMGKFSAGSTGEVMMRFQELGIVTKQQMAEMGVEFSKSGEMISPLPKALEAVVKITEGKFSGGMKALSGTFEGMKSTLSDTLQQLGVAVGKPLFDSVKSGLAELLTVLNSDAVQNAGKGIAQSIGNLVAPLSKLLPLLVSGIGGLLSVLGPVVSVIGSVSAALSKSMGIIAATAAAIALLSLAMNYETIVLKAWYAAEAVADAWRKFSIASIFTKAAATGTETAATGGATAAQWLWNTAMAANPIGAVIAGIVLLVGAIAVVANALSKSAEEKLSDAKASQEMAEADTKAAESKRDGEKANVDLLNSFKALGDQYGANYKANAEYAKNIDELNAKYPGIIDKTASYEENLKRVEEQAMKSSDKLSGFNDEVAKMKEAELGTKVITFEAQTQVDYESLNDAAEKLKSGLSEYMSGLSGLTAIGEGSAVVQEQLNKQVKGLKDVAEAATAANLEQQKSTMVRDTLEAAKALGMEGADLKNLGEKTAAFIDSQIALKKAKEEVNAKTADGKQVEAEYAAIVAKNGGDTVKATEEVAAKFGISREKALELINAQRGITSEAKSGADAVKELAEGFDKAKASAEAAAKASASALAKLVEDGKRGSKEYQDELAKGKKTVAEMKADQKALDQAEKDLGLGPKKTAKKGGNSTLEQMLADLDAEQKLAKEKAVQNGASKAQLIALDESFLDQRIGLNQKYMSRDKEQAAKQLKDVNKMLGERAVMELDYTGAVKEEKDKLLGIVASGAEARSNIEIASANEAVNRKRQEAIDTIAAQQALVDKANEILQDAGMSGEAIADRMRELRLQAHEEEMKQINEKADQQKAQIAREIELLEIEAKKLTAAKDAEALAKNLQDQATRAATLQSIDKAKTAALADSTRKHDQKEREIDVDKEVKEYKEKKEAFRKYFAGPISQEAGKMFKTLFDPNMNGAERWQMLWQDLSSMAIDMITEIGVAALESFLVSQFMSATAVASATTTGAAMAAAYAPAAALVSLSSFGANSIPAMAGIAATQAFALGSIKLPMLEAGAIALGPAIAMIGEGSVPEALVPLDRLASLMGNTEPKVEPTKMGMKKQSIQKQRMEMNANIGVDPFSRGLRYAEIKRSKGIS